MKTLLRLSLFLFAAVIGRADLVIEQKIESQIINGNSTMKIKGDKARMDMPSPVGGNVSIIMDMKSGEMHTLMHAQKMAMKMNMSDAKKAAEDQQKKTGIDLTQFEKKPTGTKEKVGEWECEIVDVKMGGMEGRMWVAKDYPNYKAIMEQMNRINAAASAGMGLDPTKMDLGGMTVKSEMTTPVGKMTTTLVKVTENPVADSEFTAPTDYKQIEMPSLK